MHRVLTTLQTYVRAEEKHRTHALNRYRHLLKSGHTDQATQMYPELLMTLTEIDQRVRASVAMLEDFPSIAAKVKPVVEKYWRDFRKENTPMVDDESLVTTGGGQIANARLLTDYKRQFESLHLDKKQEAAFRVEIEPLVHRAGAMRDSGAKLEVVKEQQDVFEHVQEHIQQAPLAFARRSDLAHSQDAVYHHGNEHAYAEPPTHGTTGLGGILLGVGAAVAVVVAVAAVAVDRIRKTARHRGFVEVDAYTPEEKHVAGMQVTGYENPTYSFFDKA